MTALVREQSRLDERWTRRRFPLKSGKQAFKGGVAVLEVSSGTVIPGAPGPGLVFLGLFAETVDNRNGGGATAPVSVDFLKEKEIVWLGNDGTITKLGQPTYLLDDQTLTATPVGTPMGPALGLNTGFGVALEVASIGGGSSSSGTSSPTIVFRPGDTSSASNVFTTWAAALAALSEIQGFAQLEIDSSLAGDTICHIPSAGMPVGGWVWPKDKALLGYNGTQGAGSTLQIDAGANVIGSLPVLVSSLTIQTATVSGDAWATTDSLAVVYVQGNTTFGTLAAGHLFAARSATFSVNCLGGNFATSVVSTGYCLAAGGTANNKLRINAFSGLLGIVNNSLSNTGHTILIRSTPPLPTTDFGPTQDASTVTIQFLNSAAGLTYAPAVSGNWASTAPTLTSQAIDRLAALAVTLNGGTPIP